MGVDVGVIPAAAFIAIFVVAALILGTAYARRRGHLRSRGALIGIAAVIAVLIVFGMGLGLVPGAANT
jgi:biotin transporter BioY